MNSTRLWYIVGFLILPITSFVARSSSIVWFAETKFLAITALVLLLAKRKLPALVLMLIFVPILDLLTFQSVIGLASLSFFVGVAMVEIIFRFGTFLSQESLGLKAGLTMVLAILIEHVLIQISGQTSNLLAPGAIISNLLLLWIAISIFMRQGKPTNAFKTL